MDSDVADFTRMHNDYLEPPDDPDTAELESIDEWLLAQGIDPDKETESHERRSFVEMLDTALESAKVTARRDGAIAMQRTALRVCSTESLKRISALSVDAVVAAIDLNAALRAENSESDAETLAYDAAEAEADANSY